MDTVPRCGMDDTQKRIEQRTTRIPTPNLPSHCESEALEYAGVPTESPAIISVSLSSPKQTHDFWRWLRGRRSSNGRKNRDAAEVSANFAKHGNKKERRLKVWKPVPAFSMAFAGSGSGNFSPFTVHSECPRVLLCFDHSNAARQAR
jgi:hypothetical protein